MILLLDTSTPTCKLTLIGDDWRHDDEWQADRQLADGLLSYLESHLTSKGTSWDDITGIAVFKGPGSFTGLRIGMSVLNALAHAKQVSIVGTTGDDWQTDALRRLRSGEDDKIVLPFYGREANITKPRK